MGLESFDFVWVFAIHGGFNFLQSPIITIAFWANLTLCNVVKGPFMDWTLNSAYQ